MPWAEKMTTETNSGAEQGWPPHFPLDCPPKEALNLNHRVFYLVMHNPPVPTDFLSAMERHVYLQHPPCQRAALSCGISQSYLEELRNIVPRLRPMMIAQAQFISIHGKLKQTGRPGHHSLWLRRAALLEAPMLFEVIP